MSGTARVLSLKVRAARTASLSTPFDGRLEMVNPILAQLGATLQGYDVRTALYPQLSEIELAGGQPTGRFVFGADRLRAELARVAPFAVVVDDDAAISLDQAILRRQSVWLARYQHVPAMLAAVGEAYPKRVNELGQLLSLVEAHYLAIETVYAQDHPTPDPGDPRTDGVARPEATIVTNVAGVASLHDQTVVSHDGDASGRVAATHVTARSVIRPATWGQPDPTKPDQDWVDRRDVDATILLQQQRSLANSDEYRYPRQENKIRRGRLVADLIDEILAEKVFSMRVPYLTQIWANELADIDLEIRRLQIAFASTFLVPATDGRITALYRQSGETVRAAEAVLLVENDAEVELVGQLRYFAPISVGQGVTVVTANVFESAPAVPLSLPGAVASVRGYDAESDKWNVVLRCANATGIRLPLGYDFEPDPAVTRVDLA